MVVPSLATWTIPTFPPHESWSLGGVRYGDSVLFGILRPPYNRIPSALLPRILSAYSVPVTSYPGTPDG